MNNPFLFALKDIKKSIEFCMDKKIDEDSSIDPRIIQAMGFLHQEISKLEEE